MARLRRRGPDSNSLFWCPPVTAAAANRRGWDDLNNCLLTAGIILRRADMVYFLEQFSSRLGLEGVYASLAGEGEHLQPVAHMRHKMTVFLVFLFGNDVLRA